MIIEWKKDNVKIIPRKSGNNVILLPGLNEVPAAVWNEIDKDLNLLGGYDGQFLTVRTEKVKENETGKTKEVKEFAEMSGQLTKEMVAECISIKTLEQWIANENRTDIRYAIEKRIDSLKDDKAGLSKKIGAKKD
jgi:hypothetical protein